MGQNYSIMTGMWACDLQDSSSLSNDRKIEFNRIIANTCDQLIESLGITILCNQFRGDGRLLVFPAEDFHANLFDFAQRFCEAINKEIEMGKIDAAFSIRTYVDVGFIQIDSTDKDEPRAVGKDVDAFCRLVDSKNPERIQVNEQGSTVLISTKKFYDLLKDSEQEQLKEISVGAVLYYILEYQYKNFTIQVLGSENTYCEDVQNSIRNFFSKDDVTTINDGFLHHSVAVIRKRGDRDNIYQSLTHSLELITKKAIKNSWNGYSIVLVDLEGRDNQEEIRQLLKHFANKKSNGFSNVLVLSDACFDEFKNEPHFSEMKKSLNKHALSATMRVYYHDYSEKLIKRKNIVYFSNLNTECVYLHSFDYGGLRLIREMTPYLDFKQHLRQQLEMALILYDGVIIHSAEVLRSEVVYDILYEYRDLIKDGSIKLLFSSKVNDIRKDFNNYIDEKIREYSISKYGSDEAASLIEAKKNESRMENAIELLSECPQMIKRDGDGTSDLEALIINDLAARFVDVILEKKEYRRINLAKCNYSLFQLLNARYIEGESVFPILPENQKREINDILDQLVNGVISASIVNNVFHEIIPDDLKEVFKGWYLALRHRANYLYAKINTGKYLYMEYLPNLYKGSLFDYARFSRAFQEYTDVNSCIGCDRLLKIRSSGEAWDTFRLLYRDAQLLNHLMPMSNYEDNPLYISRIKTAHANLKAIWE